MTHNTHLTLEKTMSISVEVHFCPITLQSLHSFEKFLLLILSQSPFCVALIPRVCHMEKMYIFNPLKYSLY